MNAPTKKSQQLGQYTKRESITLGAKATPATKIIYTRLDGDYAGKETNVTYFTGTLDEASTNVLKSLKEGDKFVINKISAPNAKDPTRPFWNLESFSPADTFVEKPAYVPRAGGFTAASKKEYDQTGVKVGAARNQAIALLTGIDFLPKGTTIKNAIQTVLDIVDQWAYEIVKRQSAMEDNIRAGIDITPKLEQALESQQQNRDEYEEEELPF